MAEYQPLFGVWDYVVLVIVLLISSSIGVYYRFTGGKQKTMQEYLLADKNMSITPVAFSLMASFMSAITLLGVSSENYTFGIQFIVINISYGIFTPVAAYLYLPVFFKLQATSAYEYLEKRFGKASRLAASLSYSLQMTLYMGVVLYAPALALEALTGISKVAAILSVGLVCTFYSTIGGMKAVLMTDVFQSILMFAAVFSIIIFAAIDKGSLAEIWRIAERGNRTELLNFNPDPTERHSWFSLIIGGGITFLSLYAVNQTQVQRYLTVKDLKTAQKALWLNWPILTCLSLSTSFAGLAMYSKYYSCDPVSAKIINSADQLMPLYVMDTMGNIPGLAGLFVAGIFSASLSTVSAALNSLAAVTVEDYYKPLYQYIAKKPLSEKRVSVQTKLIALFFGFACLAIAFLAQFLGGVLQASLTIFGVIGGPLLALFSLGMFTTTANEKGALVGLVSGISLALWMAFGNPKPPLPTLPVTTEGCADVFSNISITNEPLVNNPDNKEYFWLYKVSYLYNGVFGLVTTFLVGYLISLVINSIYGRKDQHLDPNLFIPPIQRKLQKRELSLSMKQWSESEEDLRSKHVLKRKY
ncbi:putative sodium-dependent multivitamin transporter [Tribolium castaneum]|uniref:Sodium-dependent multivitamin transporter-like Protein n=1 Tax=Tribolium castaneum TaxID=7070 RepID=D6WJW4_TRICA|nr:PREDICTED: putative sodium-dependent multivitamin transporter [Tribolium castaneum]XP_015835482.1 PREDICTED: putative sodium-dependent multivitamin transporter [Tribolium castaneum]XP_015835483.1 PREDICTED: putative sodium-dependent multivitamin transporter [Tribolium castaneum]XP_015835484.1 PREDICTED: putative sodium-dependent multivitamin transporter [Tribolium castaneum]XP_015835485.1 PREDICTED: putative sodium-dependent multivitamin transporter [Tribolium castaneum]XP_015835486.1 PREDI|eukprot:XP_015835481.1 PREDICTED: putative sodium-dependent multivitamin transporter [Tribolium castaneum]